MVFLTLTTQLLLVLLFSTCEMLVIRHQPLWPHTQATFMPSNENLDESTGTFPTILTPFAKAANGQSTDSAEHQTFVPPTDHGANNRAARPVVQSTFAPLDDDKYTDSIAQPSSVPSGNGPARPVVQSTKAPTDDVTKMNVDRTSAPLVIRYGKSTDSPAKSSDVPSGNAAARPVVQSTNAPVDDNDDVTKTNVVRTFALSLNNAEHKSTDSPAQPSAVPIGDGTEGISTKSAGSITVQPIIGGVGDRFSNKAAHQTSAPNGNGVDDDSTQKIDADHTVAPIGDNSHGDSTDSAHTMEPIIDYLEDKSSDAGDQPSSPPEHNHPTHADAVPTYVPLGYGVDKNTDEPATEDPVENINNNDNHPATGHPPMFSRSM